MLNARHSFALLWKRLMAALSLVMAAALAPAAPAPASGAGAISSRVGSGATVASATNALAANLTASLVEGGEHHVPVDTSTDGTAAKACMLPAWQEIAQLPCRAASPPVPAAASPRPTHAARSGPTRAPPGA